MTEVTIGVATTLSILALSPLGALLAAGLAREYLHVLVMSYWIGGFATASHVVVVFGP